MFILGLICGLLISILIFTILAFFRAGLERKLQVIQKNLENAGPRPKGFIVEAPDESDEVRKDLIARNKEKGIDTHISELL